MSPGNTAGPWKGWREQQSAENWRYCLGYCVQGRTMSYLSVLMPRVHSLAFLHFSVFICKAEDNSAAPWISQAGHRLRVVKTAMYHVMDHLHGLQEGPWPKGFPNVFFNAVWEDVGCVWDVWSMMLAVFQVRDEGTLTAFAECWTRRKKAWSAQEVNSGFMTKSKKM